GQWRHRHHLTRRREARQWCSLSRAFRRTGCSRSTTTTSWSTAPASRVPGTASPTSPSEIDSEAWASLHSDTSRPFPKPRYGRIAVKVINHLGDEVMKVFKV